MDNGNMNYIADLERIIVQENLLAHGIIPPFKEYQRGSNKILKKNKRKKKGRIRR